MYPCSDECLCDRCCKIITKAHKKYLMVSKNIEAKGDYKNAHKLAMEEYRKEIKKGG